MHSKTSFKVDFTISGYNFEFSYLSKHQAVTLIFAQLIPERWSGHNSQAFAVSLLSQTEVTFFHNIYANVYYQFFKPECFLLSFDNTYNNNVDQQSKFWPIECNFLKYPSSINMSKHVCLLAYLIALLTNIGNYQHMVNGKLYKELSRIEFHGSLYILPT